MILAQLLVVLVWACKRQLCLEWILCRTVVTLILEVSNAHVSSAKGA